MSKLSKRVSRPPADPHDLNAILKLARVNAPKQARSERRLREIIQALEELLDGRPFEEITIPDIAARAGCVPASIYARFKDKTSILVALHESIRDRQIAQIDESMRLERTEGLTLEESLFQIFRRLARYYSRHRHLMRPAFLLGDAEIYERAAGNVRHAADRLQAIVQRKSRSNPGQIDDSQVELATRAVYALLQQRLVFQAIPIGQSTPNTDDEMAQQLTRIFLQTLMMTSGKQISRRAKEK